MDNSNISHIQHISNSNPCLICSQTRIHPKTSQNFLSNDFCRYTCNTTRLF